MRVTTDLTNDWPRGRPLPLSFKRISAAAAPRRVTDLICMRRCSGIFCVCVWVSRRVSSRCLRARSSFAAEGDEGFSSQDTIRGEGSGAPRTKEYANPCIAGQNTLGPLLCRGYDELRGRPHKTVIGHSLQLKNATRFLFDIVLHLYSLFALRTAGHRENDNVEGFYRPIVYPQKKIVHQPFRVCNR